MGKGQHGRGQITACRQRQGDGQKGVKRAGAQARCRLHRAASQTGEGGLQRLNREGQRIDERGQDQPGKGKGQRVAGQAHPKGPERRIGSKGDQHVKADHRWGQDEGQGGQRLDQRHQTGAAAGQPPGQRGGEDQQQNADQRGEFQRQPKGFKVGQGHGAI